MIHAALLCTNEGLPYPAHPNTAHKRRILPRHPHLRLHMWRGRRQSLGCRGRLQTLGVLRPLLLPRLFPFMSPLHQLLLLFFLLFPENTKKDTQKERARQGLHEVFRWAISNLDCPLTIWLSTRTKLSDKRPLVRQAKIQSRQ